MQQIAVRGVQLHRLDAQHVAAFGGVHKVGLDLRDVGQAQFGGRGFLRQVGQGAGGHGLPAAVFGGDQHAAVPGACAGGLAARVADLDAHGHVRGQASGAVQFVTQRSLGGIVPQAQAAGADAAHGRHGSGFDGEQARAAVEQIGPVRQVPIGGLAVVGRVLAHGRNDDAVGQGEGTTGGVEGEGGKKQAHAVILGKSRLKPIRCVTCLLFFSPKRVQPKGAIPARRGR